MRVAGVVAEYNPFHNGHALHLAATRALGYDAVVAVMSGHAVQRGALAACDKWSRAGAAVAGGADLVLELPAVYACAPAEIFARAGVSLLAAFGCDAVSFGSESGDLARLTAAADWLDRPESDAALRAALTEGISYPAARQRALDAAGIDLSAPNDILGVEYIRALRGTRLEAVAVPRAGAAHDGEGTGTARLGGEDAAIASASYLRGLWRARGAEALAPFVPDVRFCLEALAADPALTDRAILLRLRTMTASEFAALPDAAEGLDRRLMACARARASVEEVAAAAKTKRYTLARIRRMLMAAAVGVTRADREVPPPYLRVLAANARGRALLSETAARRTLPLSSSLARLRSLSQEAARCAAVESAATDLFTLSLPQILPCGLDFTRKADIMSLDAVPPAL